MNQRNRVEMAFFGSSSRRVLSRNYFLKPPSITALRSKMIGRQRRISISLCYQQTKLNDEQITTSILSSCSQNISAQ